MANNPTTKNTDTKVGNYTEPGIHPNDEVDAAGHKEKFDRGDVDETKEDAVLHKAGGGKRNAEIPQEYQETGIHSGDQMDAAGHKKKFDRAAPEETMPAPPHREIQHPKTERSQPNYVQKEAEEKKAIDMSSISKMSEKEFLEDCLLKSNGWNSPVHDAIKNRLEHLNK